MENRLAILGEFTRGYEVIELLEMLGGVNGKINKNTGKAYMLYNGNYFIPDEIGNVREVAYYIDFASQIRRIDIKDITSHFIVYSLDMFLKQYPFKVGDKVQHRGATSCGSVYIIDQVIWEYKQAQVKYVISDLYMKNCKSIVTSNGLQPYKEE